MVGRKFQIVTDSGCDMPQGICRINIGREKFSLLIPFVRRWDKACCCIT